MKKKLCFLRKKLTAFIKVYISFTNRASHTNLSIPSSRTRIIFSTKRWKNFCGLILWEEIECNEFFLNFFLLNLLDLLSFDNGKLTCLYSKLFLWLQSFSVMNVQKKVEKSLSSKSFRFDYLNLKSFILNRNNSFKGPPCLISVLIILKLRCNLQDASKYKILFPRFKKLCEKFFLFQCKPSTKMSITWFWTTPCKIIY